MNYFKKYVQLVVVMITCTVSSQQLPQFTQYMYNTISINPAYAGSREVISAVGIHRSQWVGFDQAPGTQTLSVHMPLRNEKIGVGLSFIKDELGYENFTYLYADGSYTIKLNEKTKLAFGLKAGFTQYNLDSELIGTVSDPSIQGVNNSWKPNLGAGLYLHTNKYYVGFSAPRLLNVDRNKLKSLDVDYSVTERLVYYLTGGYVFDLKENIKFKPAFLVKATNGAPLSYDLTANFLFLEKFWLGGSYRINKYTGALGAIVDFQATKQLRVGYAYEHPLSDINLYSNGSHEILVMFELRNAKRVKSPRYF